MIETHPENTCSKCNNRLDAASTLEEVDIQPVEGDVSICAYCGNIGKYDSDMRITTMSDDELIELHKEQPLVAKEVLRIQSVFAYIKQKINN